MNDLFLGGCIVSDVAMTNRDSMIFLRLMKSPNQPMQRTRRMKVAFALTAASLIIILQSVQDMAADLHVILFLFACSKLKAKDAKLR